VEYGEAALAIARELALAEQEAFILNDLQYAYIMLADLGQARTMSDNALVCWRNLGNLPMLSDNLKASALVYTMSGDYKAAIEAAQECYQIAQSIENVYNQGAIKEHIAYAYRELGEFAMMLQSLEESADICEAASTSGALAEAGLALAYSEVGLIENGLALIRRAFDGVDALPPFFHFRDYLYAIQVQLHLLQGDLSAAEAALDEIQFDVIKYTNLLPLSNFVIPVIVCEISLNLGAYDQVIKITDDFIVRRTEAGARVGLADFHYLKGLAFRAQDEFEEARRALISARTEAEALGARRIWWKVLVALAEMEGRLDNQPRAVALRQEARTILDDIIEQIPEGEMRDSFVALPAVSDLLTG
jgi:tetratricopeptide (TPR) repeat protein